MRIKSKTVMDQMNAEKPDDVLAGLEAKHGCAASDGSALPSHCEKHPTAMVRHSWNESHYILNGMPSGEGIKSEHAYVCAECGRPLAEPNAKLRDAGESGVEQH